MDKNMKEARRRQEDTALNRALMWVGGAIVLEGLLLFVNRYYINFFVSEVDFASLLFSILGILRIAGAVLGVLALAWAAIRFREGQSAGLQAVVAVACLAVAFCAYITVTFQKPGVQMLFLLVPAWAGLALVYYLYQREFFVAAVASGLSGLALWCAHVGGRKQAMFLLLLVGLITLALLWLKKMDGTIHRASGEVVRVLSANTAYSVILISCVGGAAAGLLGLLLGATAAYYLVFVMFAWLFALLVYYTAKMM